MTSASELFYTRRFRPHRSPEPVLRPAFAEADRDRERDREREREREHNRLPRRQFRHRLHYHDCGSLRHTSHGGAAHGGRYLCDRGGPQTDFNGTSESSLGSHSNSEISGRNNGLILTTNDRLPGAVLQARARLLARLRGISRTESRQNTANSGISRDEFVVSDHFRAMDLWDWEADALEGLEPDASFVESTSQAAQSSSFPDQTEKKPPGLTWEAINTLQREVFKDLGDTGVASKASLECCICLDKFREGDSLFLLACGHRFHPGCLNPWVQICGDCPYCRSRIVVNPGVERKLSGAACSC